MEEIKIGEYIRTNKIERVIDKFYNENILYYKTDRGFCPTEDVIKKHSPNIIDLVEIGDYVNDERIVHISKKYGLETETYPILSKYTKITDIVTKEEFAAAKYKIKD